MAALAAAICLAACAPKADKVTMLVGTYSSDNSDGIYVFDFDQENGTAGPVKGHASLRDASFLALSADGTTVYAVSERPDSSAALAAYSFDSEGGDLNLLGMAVTQGEDPCYVASDGRIAVTANYSGGSLSVFRLAEDGALLDSAPFQLIHGTLGGPDLGRQEVPHEHCAFFTPDGKDLVASDFSADRLVTYEVAGDSLKEYSEIHLESDYGPRHILFRDGRTAYVIGELSGKITVMDYSEGILLPVQVIDCDPVHARGSADIKMTPDCRFLYASNRLENDGVTVFKVLQDGTLGQVGYTRTGPHPRNINVTPNGKFLLVACRDSDSIEVYRIDPATGLLEDTHGKISVGRPVCIQFVGR